MRRNERQSKRFFDLVLYNFLTLLSACVAFGGVLLLAGWNRLAGPHAIQYVHPASEAAFVCLEPEYLLPHPIFFCQLLLRPPYRWL